VTWPLDGGEAGVDLVLIQTSLLLLCKTSCSNAKKVHLHYKSSEACIKTRSTPASLPPKGQVPEKTTVKWSIDMTNQEAAASSSDRAALVRALAGDIVLCSWARHLTLTVPLSTQVYEMGTGEFNAGGNSAMD